MESRYCDYWDLIYQVQPGMGGSYRLVIYIAAGVNFYYFYCLFFKKIDNPEFSYSQAKNIFCFFIFKFVYIAFKGQLWDKSNF